MPGREWVVSRVDPADKRQLAQALGVSPLLAQVLLNRGLTAYPEARAFLYGGLGDLQDSSSLPGISRALELLAQVVAGREKVLICGDYDVDGLTSTALLYSFLISLGIEAGYYIPDRLSEGYGLHQEALAKALSEGYQTVVTVDCGLTAHEEIAWAREQGLKVVVTDHHHPPPILPPADAVVIPSRGQDLAGVGVVFHLIRALDRRLNCCFNLESWLDLVALGTIADVVPLRGDNRVLVREGLKLLDAGERPGLRELAAISGMTGQGSEPRRLAFTLIPRLNAPGRLGNALPALELLLASATEEAAGLARELDRLNKERQAIEKRIAAQAREMMAQEVDLDREGVIVLSSPLWHRGVVGIVAGHLAEECGKPVLLLAVEDEEATGSGRSVPGVSLYGLLSACGEWLSRFGGHDQAVGLSLPVNNLPALRRQLAGLSPGDTSELAKSPVYLDAEVFLNQLDEELLKEISLMEPFGQGNSPPLFVSWGTRLVEARAVGRNGGHLRLVVEAEGDRKAAIGFGLGPLAATAQTERGLRPGQLVDLAFCPLLENYQGRTLVKLQLAGVRPTAASGLPTIMAEGTSEVAVAAEFPPQGTHLQLRAEEFSVFWKTMSGKLQAESRNCLVTAPSASLAGCLALWLRDLGLRVVRVRNSLGNKQVAHLAERLRRTAGVVLVSTAGFWGQHAAVLSATAEAVRFDPPSLEPEAPFMPDHLLPPRLSLIGWEHSPNLENQGRRLDFTGFKALLETGKRLILYSRNQQQAEALLKRLRPILPGGGREIGLYHPDMPPPVRQTVARSWTQGERQVLVSTVAAAALGGFEGAEAVFCYPPFSWMEYTLLGLGASDSYCCWPKAEETVNERLLASLWPPAALLKLLYRSGGRNLEQCGSFSQRAVQMALAVLEECAGSALTASWRYREARSALGAWMEFQGYVNNLPSWQKRI